jgi:hypothetical protein
MNCLWESNGLKILRHFEGCYSLTYFDKAVMPETSFDAITDYVWAEFI